MFKINDTAFVLQKDQ